VYPKCAVKHHIWRQEILCPRLAFNSRLQRTS
jgi:hypothetical protein